MHNKRKLYTLVTLVDSYRDTINIEIKQRSFKKPLKKNQ